MNIINNISTELNIQNHQVENTINLLAEGSTIPFISRYRKEKTGNLDEVVIAKIQELNQKYLDIEKRRTFVLNFLKTTNILTVELENSLINAQSISEIEDIYLPFKPKRKTKSSVAIENGLKPLAKIIISQKNYNILKEAKRFINKNILDENQAIENALFIIADWINENKYVRNKIRFLFSKYASINSKLIKSKEEEAEKFKDYFDFSENLNKCPSHRFLAINKGANLGFLRTSISIDSEIAIEKISNIILKSPNESTKYLKIAIKDSFKRLISPSIEKEFFNQAKEKADLSAISVFANNLRQLLLSPPLQNKNILGIDPGFRTGCKVVCIDTQGNLKTNCTIYPHKPQQDTKLAAKKISSLCQAYKINAIAIGNGTASRETEFFIKNIKFTEKIQVFVVSEDGASIYSASKIAREEFPQYDVTVRGAVSIARRLQDPLSELVKIEPKSLGVGQYQHDVDQKKLKESLNLVVESCVNSVGVNINTASKHLLSYISGIGEKLAEEIVEYRKKNGDFTNRKQILKVPKMGKKAFEQSAGFLRIVDGDNILDNSAVHPESYFVVEKIAKDLKLKIEELINNDKVLDNLKLDKYIDKEIGELTLKDIIEELKKPGRDPRKIIKILEFDSSIRKIEDLKIGIILPGIVNNITNFGAFVDIGIKENGLIHVSNITSEFISNPAEVLALHQHVKVKVIDIDVSRKRIQLSMIDVEQ